MKLLKLIPSSNILWDTFISSLFNELKCLERDHFHFQLESTKDQELYVCCHTFPEHLSRVEVRDTFRHYFCTAFSDFMIEHFEEDYIREKIKEDFYFEDPLQIESIYQYCYFFLFLNEDHQTLNEHKIRERKSKIFKQCLKFLDEEKEFHLEGFIYFRNKEYLQELSEIIEYAIDEYILDKEYQDFIQLLKYFISIQESKISFLHVYHIRGQQFILFDQFGNPITDSEIEEHMKEWSEQPFGHEEVIVSTLLALNPKLMTVHTDDIELPIIRTIQKIFGEQVSICQGCTKCQKWKASKRIDVKT